VKIAQKYGAGLEIDEVQNVREMSEMIYCPTEQEGTLIGLRARVVTKRVIR